MNSQPENEKDSAWLTPARFAILLALFVIASFPQIIFGLQTFVFRDFGYFGYPLAFYFRESFWRGEIPLWDPLNNCGAPFLAQWNTMVLYPPSLFYLLFPLSWSLGVFCVLHLFLAGLGMYFLAHRWAQNRVAAAFAGITFGFNGLALNCLMWPATIAALAWMPWVVWLVERAWSDGGKNIAMAAIVGALQMLSGGVEVVLMTWVPLGAIALGEFVRGELPREKIILRCAAVVLLISGLCAAQLLPFFDLLKHSQRQEHFIANHWPMPVTGLGNFLVPLFHSQHAYHGVFMQIKQYWTDSYYVGASTITLSVCALCWLRGWRPRLLAVLAACCLVLAFGDATPIYRWLSAHVGAFNLMRFPVKFVILPVLVFPLLAALAFTAKNKNTGRSRTLWRISGATLVVIFALLWLAWKFPQPNDDVCKTCLNGFARAGFFTAIFAVWFVIGKISEIKMRRLLQIVLLALVWLDLLFHMPQPPTVFRAIYEPNLPRSLPAPRHGQSRAMLTYAARTELVHSFIPDIHDDYVSRRFTLFCDCNLLDGISKTDGFFPLFLREHLEVASLFYYDDTNHPPPAPLLDFLGVSVISSPTNIFEWEARTNFLPLVTGGQKSIFKNESETFACLGSLNFNPRAEVFLPPEAKPFVTATNPSTVTISNPYFGAQRIEFEAQAESPAVIVIAQTFYHPWLAIVDGKPAQLWRANHAFQAVEIPIGRHKLKLVYRDRMFEFGVVISLISLVACVLIFLKMRQYKPPLPQTAE